MKNLFIALLSLFFVLGCGQMDKTENKPAPQSAPIPVKADVLTREYKENELAADAKYKGKILEVSGKIDSIAEVLGTIQIDLEGHQESGIKLTSVKCAFDQSQKESLLKLKTGQNITFQGTNEGMTANLYVGLDGCKIK